MHLPPSKATLPDQAATRGVCRLPESGSAPVRSTLISAHSPKQEPPRPAITVSWSFQEANVILHLYPHLHPPMWGSQHSTQLGKRQQSTVLSQPCPDRPQPGFIPPSHPQQLLRETPGVRSTSATSPHSPHSPRGKVIWSHMPSSCPKYTLFSEGWIPSSIILQDKLQCRGRAETAEQTGPRIPTEWGSSPSTRAQH